MKIFEVLDIWQRDILTQRFFKEIARHNGFLQSGHEVGTLQVVIGTGSP